jgi:hypothetical protein
MMQAMPLSELHPFTEAELATAPEGAGVYVLFQVENPIHSDEADNLRAQLRKEKLGFPRATHFAVETGHADAQRRAARLQEVQAQLNRVRSRTFTGR